MEPAAVLRLLLTAEGVRETQLQLARVNAEAKRTADSTGKLEKAFNSANNSTSKFNRNMTGLRNAIGIIKWPALIAGAGGAAQAVGALGTASVAVASALAPLAGELAGQVGLYSALGQGVGVAKLALSGVSQALGGNKKAYQNLTPAQKTFVDQLKGMKGELKGIQQTAAQGLLPGVVQGLRITTPLIARLRPIIGATAKEMGNLAVQAAHMLVSMGPAFQRIGQNNVQVIGNLGKAAIALGQSLIRIVDAARPLTLWMSEMIKLGAQWIDSQLKAAQASGKLANFLASTQVVMTTLGHIIGNLVVGFYNIGKAAVPLGNDLLRQFTDLTAKFREWTQSAAGKNQIAAYFRAAQPAVHQVLGLLGDAAKLLAQVFKPQPGTAGMIGDLRKLLNVLGGVFITTARTLGPAAIQLLTNLARILGSVAGTSGPLTLLVKILAKITGAIANFVGHNQALSTTVSFLGGLGAVSGILGFFAGRLAKVGENVAKMVLVFRKLPEALAVAKGAIAAFSVFVEANPLALPFTILAGAIAFALTHLKQFERGAKLAWEGIKHIFAEGVATVLGFVSTFLHGIGSMLDAISNVPGLGWVKGLADDVNHAGDSIDKLRNKLLGVGEQNKRTAKTVSVAWGGASQNLQRAVTDMLHNYGDFHDKVGTTNASLQKNFNIAYTRIEDYINHHTGRARDEAEANLKQLVLAHARYMNSMSHKTDMSMGSVLTTIGSDTSKAAHQSNSNMTNLQQTGSHQLDVFHGNTKNNLGAIFNTIATQTMRSANTGGDNMHTLQDRTQHWESVARGNTNSNLGAMLSTIGSKTRASAAVAGANFNKLASNIRGGMTSGAFATFRGINYITGAVSKGLSALGSAVKVNVSLAIPKGFARGGMVDQPTYMVGEEAPRHPEVVVATNPAYRAQNIKYWAQAGKMLGMPGFEKGGIPGFKTGGYVYPFPGGTHLGRTDQGVDTQIPAGGLFRAMGDAIIGATSIGGWPGGPLMNWTLQSGPARGRMVYLAEMIRPLVHSGQHVSGNTAVAVSTGPSQEMGWWTGGPYGETLARATSGYTEGQVTAAGRSFLSFIGGGKVGPALAAIASIIAPHVHGGGYLGKLVQVALDKTTTAANAFVQAHAPVFGGGQIGAIPASTGNVERDIYKALTARGWNKVAVAAAIGNAFQESGLNPGITRGGNGGLFGFTSGAVSLSSLMAAAHAKGVPWTSAGFQAAFMAAHYGDLRTLNAYRDPRQAALYFMNTFERPAAASANIPNREAAAARAYAQGYAQGGWIPPFAGSFAGGGIVPGPLGAPRTAIVHGGESISNNSGPLVAIENLNVHDDFDERALAHKLAFLIET